MSRAVLLAFRGPPVNPGHVASHVNGNPADNRLVNLVWESQRDNLRRMRGHGTAPLRDKHWNHKLSWDVVDEIRRQWATGTIKQIDLASKFGLHRNTVRLIIHEYIWRREGFDIQHQRPTPYQPIGRKCGRWLTKEQVAAIRRDYAGSDVSQAELGRRYGVTQAQVSNIVNRRQWRDDDGSQSCEGPGQGA